MPVADHVHERDEDVKARIQRPVIAAEPLDDEGALLRHHHRRLEDDEEHQQGDEHEDDENVIHVGSLLSQIEHQALNGHHADSVGRGQVSRCPRCVRSSPYRAAPRARARRAGYWRWRWPPRRRACRFPCRIRPCPCARSAAGGTGAGRRSEITGKSSHCTQGVSVTPTSVSAPTASAAMAKKMTKKPPGVASSSATRARPRTIQYHQSIGRCAPYPGKRVTATS